MIQLGHNLETIFSSSLFLPLPTELHIVHHSRPPMFYLEYWLDVVLGFASQYILSLWRKISHVDEAHNLQIQIRIKYGSVPLILPRTQVVYHSIQTQESQQLQLRGPNHICFGEMRIHIILLLVFISLFVQNLNIKIPIDI